MKEASEGRFQREVRKPYEAGEFTAQAALLEALARDIERLRWEGQDDAGRAVIQRAAFEARSLALGFYRAEFLLSPTRPRAVSTAAAQPPPSPESGPEPPASGERHPRVSFTGNLGIAPRFRTTSRGKQLAELRVGVHEDNGKTAWQTVLVQGEARVQRLRQAGLTQGQALDVIGYVHERTYTARSGETRHVREIWAAHVRLQRGKVGE